MADWNITPERQLTLTLASDARLGPTDYTNDQIWELNFGNSEPPSLSLQTTFGLRARICRIFPRFIHNGQVIFDPAQYYRPIIIHKYFPNFISLSFKPFSSINVNIEYWVPGSHVIAGRSKITNTGHETCQFQLEWAELLIPSSEGTRMAADQIGLITVLTGQTSNLFPVLFLTGGVQAGNSPYPSLNLTLDIPPRGEQESRWVNASLEDLNASFELTKDVIKRNWDAEFARCNRLNAQQLEITTGNPDWNTAFHLAQTIASQLILQATEKCQAPSFVSSRIPDQGFSMLKDGSDYNHHWNGQTASDAYYLTNFLLPSSPELLKGFLDNFIATQSAQGEIDWKPGLGGQRSQLQATPLLSCMAWLYYESTHDDEYIRTVFPQLLKFFYSWFNSSHDRDNDSIPEWDQTIQTGYDDHPLFSYTHPWSVGMDISTVESPDLISYLFRENQSLVSMAKLIGDGDESDHLALVSSQLKQMVDQTWSDQHVSYLYRDRDSHLSTQGEIFGTLDGPGILEIHQIFPQPIRPLFRIKSIRERTQSVQVYIHGTTPAGAHRVDHIPPHRIHWHLGSGFITSETIYQSIERIEITGIVSSVEVVAHSADLTGLDQTLLLPLWAGIPTDDKAKILTNLTILNKKKFLSPYGLRSNILKPEGSDVTDEYFAMHLPWISMILEGMLHYGMQKKTAVVFTRLIKGVLNSIKQEMKFHQSYHSETGKPMGAINSLSSLIPVGLFLKILGIKIVNPSTIEITSGDPFPWSVTIKFRGLTLVHHEKKTLVIFPDGQNVTVENDRPQIISVISD